MSREKRVTVSDENYNGLKKAAAARGVSMASFVNNLIENFGVDDKSEKVILSIPSPLTRKNAEGLKDWLKVRMEAIVKAYYPKE